MRNGIQNVDFSDFRGRGIRTKRLRDDIILREERRWFLHIFSFYKEYSNCFGICSGVPNMKQLRI